MTVKTLIEEINAFLKGNDHSLTPQLRRLHDTYAEYASELQTLVEEYKKLATTLSRADAAAKARQLDPSLDARAEMLDFPRREEFLEICAMYQLAPIPEIDRDFIDQLTGPLDAMSQNLAALMKEWRRIARTGSASQRMGILRKIVASQPEGDAWKRNLVEVEKKRYEEIKAFLDESTEKTLDLQTLEGLNQELHSPLLLSKPPREIVRSVLEKLLPLQEKKVAERLEECLKTLEISFGERDKVGMEAALQRWNELASGPLAHPEPGQRQYVDDVRNTLEHEREEAERKEQYDSLLEQFRNAMADAKTPYAEALGLYNQLVLLDLPLPQALQEDMDRLTEEHESTERRLHTRRVIFGFFWVIVIIVALGGSVAIIQHRNRVRKCCAEIKSFLEAGDFAGAIGFVDSLAEKDARTVSSPSVQALYEDAKGRQAQLEERRRLAKAEFQQLKQNLDSVVLEDYLGSGEMENILGHLDELMADLDEEDKKDAIGVVTSIRAKYRQVVQAHRQIFTEKRDALFQTMEELGQNIAEIPMAQIEEGLQKIDREMTELREDTTIDAGLRSSTDDQFAQRKEKLQYIVETERGIRATLDMLRYPEDMEEYSKALEIAAATKDEARFLPYQRVYSLLPGWKDIGADLTAIADNLSSNMPIDGFATSIGRNYLAFLSQGDGSAFGKFLQTVKGNFDYYELVAKDDRGRSYFFYSTTTPVAEFDRRNRKDHRYVGFKTDVFKNAQDCFAFMLERNANGKVVYHDVDYLVYKNARNLPESFVSLEGWYMPTKSDVYRLVSEANGMGNNGESQFQLVKAMLKKSKTIRNPIVQYWFSMECLKLLKELLPMATDYVDQLIQEIENPKLQVARWKNPKSYVEVQAQVADVQSRLEKLDVERIATTSDMLWQFLGAFYSRKLVPVGVVSRGPDGENLGCWYFPGAVFGESCVFMQEDGKFELHLLGEGKSTRWIVQERMQGTRRIVKWDDSPADAPDKQSAQWNSQMGFEGQLIWAFADGRTTKDFLLEWRKNCQDARVTLQVAPAICPTELRYLLK